MTVIGDVREGPFYFNCYDVLLDQLKTHIHFHTGLVRQANIFAQTPKVKRYRCLFGVIASVHEQTTEQSLADKVCCSCPSLSQ
jgi:hypothetical protein